MELNLVTIVAQMINLFFLVFLLSRFLFGPITSIMAEREQRIKTRLDQGRDMMARGEELAEEYRQRTKELDDQKHVMLKEAQQEGEEQRRTLLEEASQEAKTAQSRFRSNLEQEKHRLRLELQEEVIKHSCQLSSQLLAELADADLQEQALYVLIKRLQAADTKEIELLKAGLANDQCLEVTTGQSLPSPTQTEVENTIREACQPHQPVITFAVSPDLVFGATIQTDAARLQWNAADYLRQVEQEARQQLLEQGTSQPSAGDEHA